MLVAQAAAAEGAGSSGLAAAGWPAALALLIGLICCSMFFSISETSLFALQKIDREALKEDRTVGEVIGHLLHRPRRLLAAILIGNELANVGLSAASAALIAEQLPEKWQWLNIVFVAPVLIIFGEVLPKTLGLRFSRSIARRVARPLNFWNEVVSPVRWVLSGIGDLILRLLGVSPAPLHDSLQETQLRSLIDQGRETGVIQPIEQEIIHRVFEFGDLPVSRVMTPRPDIFSLSVMTPWAELLEEIRSARYSRVPVWQGSPDNIVGVLLVKDLLRHRDNPPSHARQLQKLLHPAMFVPPSKRAQDLLREFRAKNNHLAIVVDEHGSIAGLVTLDDLLTELVGEVLDESDVDEKEAVQLQEKVWTVRANIDIEDFDTRFGVSLPEGDYTTLAGFVFHQLGAAPQKGDEVTWNGLLFHVSGVDGRRITEVTLTFRHEEPVRDEEEVS